MHGSEAERRGATLSLKGTSIADLIDAKYE
jgi:hypothetical protein